MLKIFMFIVLVVSAMFAVIASLVWVERLGMFIILGFYFLAFILFTAMAIEAYIRGHYR